MNDHIKTAAIAAVTATLVAVPATVAADEVVRGFFSGADIVSSDTSRTALGVRGHEAAGGTTKISHEPSSDGATDPNASALSLRTEGNGTAAQGIFLDAPGGTTGKSLNFRQRGVEYLTLTPPNPTTGAPAVLKLNGKIVATLP